MNPTVLLIVQALIQYGPEAAKAIQALFAQTTPPTQAQWDALFATVQPLYAGSTTHPAS